MSQKPSTISSHTQEVRRLLDQLERQPLNVLAAYLRDAANLGGIVYTAGNGGSATNASHLAAHLNERGVRSHCLTDNIPALTAAANDHGYADAFVRERYFRQVDAVVALSCSGNSPNILVLLDAARTLGARTFALLGFGGGKAEALCDLSIVLDSQNYGAIEDAHSTAVHILRELLA